MTLVDITVELFYSGTWHDITPDVLTRDGGIRIDRGRRDAGSASDHGTMSLQLRGRESQVVPGVTGRYSPNNPRSDLYGLIGRYTPIRVRVPSRRAGLWLPNTQDGDRTVGVFGHRAWAQTPNVAALGITADIDLRTELTPEAWNPPHADVLAAKWGLGAADRSWSLSLHHFSSGGFLVWLWSEDGITGTSVSSAVHGLTSGRATVRVTMDVDNGAAQREIRFWIGGEGVDGPFTQFGSTQTGAVTSIFDGSAPVRVGASGVFGSSVAPFTGANPLRGTVHRMQLRSGIDGTVVLDTNFEAQEPGVVEFTDSTGLAWTLLPSEFDYPLARISNPGVRAEMEMVQWPQRSDPSGRDVWVPAEAAGIIYRLGKGQETQESTLRRHTLGEPGLVAYWPCEDGKNATHLAPAVPRDIEMQLVGEVSVAAFDGFPGSGPIPTLRADGATHMSRWIRPHTNGDDQYRGIFSIPDEGLVDGQLLVWLDCMGSSFTRAQIVYGTAAGDPPGSGNALRLELRNNDGVLLDESPTVEFGVDNTMFLIALNLTQDGSDVDWTLAIARLSLADTRASADASLGQVSGTFPGHTFGRFIRIKNGILGAAGLSFGHQTVLDSTVAFPLTSELIDALVAFSGERAADRFIRMAGERDVAAYLAGQGGNLSEPMGPQPAGRLINLLQECADADHGILHEGRDTRAVALLPGKAMYRIGPHVTLDYSASHPSPPLHPTDDDRFLVNDVTVSQLQGSSAREFLAEGRLSVLEPPDGVGTGHEQTPTRNIHSALRLSDHARALVNEGVWQESRYTAVRVDLRRIEHNLQLPDLREALLQLDTGWRLDLTGLPDWLAARDARTIVQGYGEQIEREGHTITFATHPHGPAGQVGWYADDSSVPAPDAAQRYSPYDHRTSGSFVVGTDTVLSVQDQTGGKDLPGSPDLPLDLVVRGVVLRATAFAAPVGDTYDITVQLASLNGLDGLTISAGEPVELYAPARYAL